MASKYQETLKKVQAEKPKENYMVVTIGYDVKLVLPWSAGLELVRSLSTAEVFVKEYGKRPVINPVNRDTTNIALMSAKEYTQTKMSMLLNMDIEDFDKMEAETV